MKKLTAVLLALCMAATCFAACSKEGKSTDDSAATPPLAITYDATYGSFDPSVYSAYETLCNAIFSGETSARFNIGLMEDVLQLYYTSFPLQPLADVTENEDGSGALITYHEDTEAVKEHISAFAEKINALKTECYAGTVSKTVYTLNLYRYICESYTEGDAENVYETVMNGNGNSETYTRLFEYLLQQADIPAYHIIAADERGATTPMTEAELDGQLYYFDVATERMLNGGKALRYFGMTTDDLATDMVVSTMYTNMAASSYASDLRFDSCRTSVAWEISGASLLVTMENGTVAEIEL